jgi:hypothetical protein
MMMPATPRGMQGTLKLKRNEMKSMSSMGKSVLCGFFLNLLAQGGVLGCCKPMATVVADLGWFVSGLSQICFIDYLLEFSLVTRALLFLCLAFMQ